MAKGNENLTIEQQIFQKVQAVTAIAECPSPVWLGTEEAAAILTVKGVKNRTHLMKLVNAGALDGAFKKGKARKSGYSFHMQQCLTCMDTWNEFDEELQKTIIENQEAAHEMQGDK